MNDRLASLNARVDDIDDELGGVIQMAGKSFWPAVAVAFALIEDGIVKRETLLAITDLLHHYASARADPDFAEDQLHVLEAFRTFLADPMWNEGRVVEQLRQVQATDAAAALVRGFLKRRETGDR